MSDHPFDHIHNPVRHQIRKGLRSVFDLEDLEDGYSSSESKLFDNLYGDLFQLATTGLRLEEIEDERIQNLVFFAVHGSLMAVTGPLFFVDVMLSIPLEAATPSPEEDLKQWLKEKLEEEPSPDRADEVVEMVDDLLLKGDFETVNRIFDLLNRPLFADAVEDEDLVTLLLTVTNGAEERFPAREDFLLRIERFWSHQKGEKETERLLVGFLDDI